jgi:hypothetical protein
VGLDRETLRSIAITALTSVAANPKAASAARAAAARTILETLGDIGRLQELARAAEKPSTELTPQEIDNEIARLESKRRKHR